MNWPSIIGAAIAVVCAVVSVCMAVSANRLAKEAHRHALLALMEIDKSKESVRQVFNDVKVVESHVNRLSGWGGR
jgi:hypothetical protein